MDFAAGDLNGAPCDGDVRDAAGPCPPPIAYLRTPPGLLDPDRGRGLGAAQYRVLVDDPLPPASAMLKCDGARADHSVLVDDDRSGLRDAVSALVDDSGGASGRDGGLGWRARSDRRSVRLDDDPGPPGGCGDAPDGGGRSDVRVVVVRDVPSGVGRTYRLRPPPPPCDRASGGKVAVPCDLVDVK